MSSYNDPIHHSAIRSSPSSDNIYQYQPLPGPRVTRHHGIPSLNVISSLISTSLATGCRPQRGCIFINGNSDETEILSLQTMLSSVICNKCSSFFLMFIELPKKLILQISQPRAQSIAKNIPNE